MTLRSTTEVCVMISVNSIEVRAHARATEVLTRVESAVMAVYPRELHEKVRIVHVMAEGICQTPMVIVTAILQGADACLTTLRSIFAGLSQRDRQELMDTLDSRVDESCKLYLRLDKQAAYLGRLEMGRGPDLMSMQVHIKMYPRCNLANIRRLLEEMIATLESESK